VQSADHAGSPDNTAEERSRAPIEVRCESCRSVVSTAHAWDNVTCACGNVTVSGRPWRPTVSWAARPGSGWSAAEPDSAEPSGDDAETEVLSERPIGFAPRH